MNRQQQVIFDKDSIDLLFVERKKVVDMYASMDKAFPREAAYSVQKALESLFGDKCLPDTEPETTRKNTQGLSLSDKQSDETKGNKEEKDNRQALYDALCELESASKKVRKALISLQ